MILRTLAVAMLLLLAAPTATAQQVDDEQPPELHCERLTCACSDVPRLADASIYLPRRQGCFQVSCRCAQPGDTSIDQQADTAELPPPSAPHALSERRPPPLFGALLPRSSFGLKLEVGFPFFQIGLLYGVHEIVEIGAAFRSFWGLSLGGYGSIRVRLYENATGNSSLSLGIRLGYNQVREDSNYLVALSGGDSGYGEVHLGFNVGRYGHAAIFDLGLRLAWVQAQPECEGSCYSSLSEEGYAHLMPVPFVEVGYAVRFSHVATFYIANGVEARMLADDATATARARMGFILDF